MEMDGHVPNQSKKRENPAEPAISARPRLLPPVLIDPNQRYSIPEANAILRQSRAKTYLDIGAGKLHVVKDGARRYIHGTELIRRSRPSA